LSFFRSRRGRERRQILATERAAGTVEPGVVERVSF
jgi:hypothetical protein